MSVLEIPAEVREYCLAHGHTDESLARYLERVPVDLLGIAPFIPEGAQTIWDIGCGLGGLTALITRDWPITEYRLTDGAGSDERKVGFKVGTKGSFEQRIASLMVKANRNPDAREVPDWARGECELVVSLKALGHHFPVDTYLPEISRSLRFYGRLILDIRTGTDGVGKLRAAGFRELGLVMEKPKRRRLAFERG